MFLYNQSFTIFDVETTGLDPKAGHRIVEIGAVRIEEGSIKHSKTFQSLVNPERTVPPEAVSIHGISVHDLKRSPTSMEILPLFLNFAHASILVAHNARFDLSFLEAEKDSCWGYVELPECLCTLELSKKLFPHEARHGLDIIAARLGVSPPSGRHRALFDACLTAEVFLRLLEKGKFATLNALRQVSSSSVLCQ